ncbi:MAG: LPS assembly lipoprotein LptE [Phycisphaerae bacterium]|nr:LPS assembly lipoprotein LptE [Phycisphaerae bacterium]
MNAMKTCIVFAALLLLATAFVPSCASDGHSGYTVTNQYRPGIKTVAVDMWQRGKNVYRREIEIRATEAVVKRIEQDTPYKVTDKSRADTLLTGSIDEVEQRTLSFSPDTGLPRETELTLIVSFAWKDLRTGQTILERKGMKISGSYTREDPITEDFFQGSEDVINRLARRVVEHMEQPW